MEKLLVTGISPFPTIFLYPLNPLPNNKILDLTKLKAFSGDKLNDAEVTISLFDGVEKHFVKKIKCWLPAFSPFPTVFSKTFFFRVVKSQDCVVKGYEENLTV